MIPPAMEGRISVWASCGGGNLKRKIGVEYDAISCNIVLLAERKEGRD